jgi:hypothetical protein
LRDGKRYQGCVIGDGGDLVFQLERSSHAVCSD